MAANEYLAHTCAKFHAYPSSGDVTMTSQSWVVGQIFAPKSGFQTTGHSSGTMTARDNLQKGSTPLETLFR